MLATVSTQDNFQYRQYRVSEDSKSPDFYLAKATGAFSVNKPPAPFSFQKPQPIIRWGTVPQTIGRLMILKMERLVYILQYKSDFGRLWLIGMRWNYFN